MTDRRVRVLIPAASRTHDLDGLAAELVALVAASALSSRTLRLLLTLALEEARLAAIDYGSLTVALNPGQIRVGLHEERPRVQVDGR